jgi:carbonic anhydrase/acetyltransferase-like protein (isoleucine patch superfamily)
LQSHSLEDGAFKSDHVRIGNGCTIGTKAYVSYGTVLEDGATIEPDSFLMKGEAASAGSVWRGNPAREM